MIIKYLYISLGLISLGLGFIGIFLPLLPTTPFLLLSAYLFAKSSPKLHNWMLYNKYFGEYLRKYKEGKGIPLKTKVLSISLLWTTILYLIIFTNMYILVKILVSITSTIVTIHIIKQPNAIKD